LQCQLQFAEYNADPHPPFRRASLASGIAAHGDGLRFDQG
jgi:hypothetical protein